MVMALCTRPIFGQSQAESLCHSTVEKAVSRAIRFQSDAQQLGKSVRVYVKFTVDKEGQYQNVAVANLGPIDEPFKKEVSRVWSILPKQDRKCSGDYVIPITFMLGENGPKQLKPVSNNGDKVVDQDVYTMLDEVSVVGYTLCELTRSPKK